MRRDGGAQQKLFWALLRGIGPLVMKLNTIEKFGRNWTIGYEVKYNRRIWKELGHWLWSEIQQKITKKAQNFIFPFKVTSDHFKPHDQFMWSIGKILFCRFQKKYSLVLKCQEHSEICVNTNIRGGHFRSWPIFLACLKQWNVMFQPFRKCILKGE